MDYKNTEVVLTINIGGAQALRGSYDFKQTGISIEKSEDGVISKYPVGKLEIKQFAKMHDCTINTTLRNDFVNWAISDEARPRKSVSANHWNDLSKINRLKFHIEKYVVDLYGHVEFSYLISE